MTATIVMPFDGSALAEHALPYAVELAKATRARLVLLRVMPVTPLIPRALTDEAERAELTAAADRVRGQGIEVEPVVRHVGYESVANAILEEVRHREAVGLVMSTHGRGGLGRWVYGSVADEVLRATDVPVLLVPPAAPPRWANYRAFNVLVPLDGSALSEASLPAAALLAGALGGELTLLQVVEPADYPLYPEAAVYIPFDPAAAMADARAYLEGIAARLRADGRRVTVEVAVGKAAEVIAATARETQAAVVALATHGRGGVARFATGSVATGVVQQATTPILIVRPSGVRRLASLAPPTEAGATPLGRGGNVELRLSREELTLVKRALTELTYTKSSVPQLTDPARDLIHRVDNIESALSAFEAAPTPVGTA